MKSTDKLAVELVSNNKNQVAQFKVPAAAAPPRKKTIVLDEDTYVKKIESIIQRDFFPDLIKYQVQSAYLEALETNDIPRLREIYEKYSVGPTVARSQRGGSQSPATFETPVRDAGDAESERGGRFSSQSSSGSVIEDDKKESLDEFLFKNTSEDNESFEEMMDESKRKHRLKVSSERN